MKNDIKIKMLGKFEILLDGRPVFISLSQSRKAMQVMQYLFLNYGKRVPHDEMVEVIWGGESSTNPDMALRAIMHRIRETVKAENIHAFDRCILTGRGYYQWNTELGCEIDVAEMEAIFEKYVGKDKSEYSSAALEKILRLYTGRLLPAFAGESWVERHSVELHNKYQTALYELISRSHDKQDDKNVWKLCKRALELEPYEERLYIIGAEALENLGDTEAKENLLEKGRELGCLHSLGGYKLSDNYRSVMFAMETSSSEMGNVLSKIVQEEHTDGAYFCNYENFCHIYRLQRRIGVRYGTPLLLALLTLTQLEQNDSKKSQEAILAGMMNLEHVLHIGLRNCDVVARYSSNQFIVLLNATDSTVVPLERIKNKFYSEQGDGEFILSYEVRTPQ